MICGSRERYRAGTSRNKRAYTKKSKETIGQALKLSCGQVLRISRLGLKAQLAAQVDDVVRRLTALAS